jgi:hypothetical protein
MHQALTKPPNALGVPLSKSSYRLVEHGTLPSEERSVESVLIGQIRTPLVLLAATASIPPPRVKVFPGIP